MWKRLAQDSKVDTMTGDGGNKYFRQGRETRDKVQGYKMPE